jgi:hypothetical protein
MLHLGVGRSFLKRTSTGTSSPALLPQVGPFASLASTPVTSVPNRTVSGGEFVATNSRASPMKYNTLTIQASSELDVDWSTSNTSQAFIWANIIILNQGAQVNARGENGSEPQNFCCSTAQGGDGGRGGSGGGGGGATNFGLALGGNGGSGGNGDGGQGLFGSAGGVGGGGYGSGYNTGYSYGNGSDGTTNSGSTSGAGGNGFGGGGSGGNATEPCCVGSPTAGGGGGGGGGLIVLVCNWFQPDLCGCGVSASGGLGSAPFGAGDPGGDGGAGVVWIATKRFDPSAGVGIGVNGTFSFFEITTANTLVARTLADSWNNT